MTSHDDGAHAPAPLSLVPLVARSALCLTALSPVTGASSSRVGRAAVRATTRLHFTFAGHNEASRSLRCRDGVSDMRHVVFLPSERPLERRLQQSVLRGRACARPRVREAARRRDHVFMRRRVRVWAHVGFIARALLRSGHGVAAFERYASRQEPQSSSTQGMASRHVV